ncbi:hypothetical protein TWF696_001835 [Orbilia brochopaga]|uniref:F-box domain-containing protein n=1 Tax=Orbilia brochopaga TaxID=3140254 RepID=A0AAV9U8N1_9PEZI
MPEKVNKSGPWSRLPAELNMVLLDYLYPSDQLAAATAYPAIKKILKGRAAFRRGHYTTLESWSDSTTPVPRFRFHRIVAFPHDGLGPHYKHFCFQIQDGSLKSWAFKCPSGEGDTSSQAPKPRDVWRDLSECIFLDEPLLSPDDIPVLPSDTATPSTGDIDVEIPPKRAGKSKTLRRKRRGIYTGPREASHTTLAQIDASDHGYFFYEDGDDTPYNSDDDHPNETRPYTVSSLENPTASDSPFWATTAITGPRGESWEDGQWSAQLCLRRQTTVREVLEAVAREMQPVLQELGLDTSVPHEVSFAFEEDMSRDHNDPDIPRWCLTATVVTCKGDTYDHWW